MRSSLRISPGILTAFYAIGILASTGSVFGQSLELKDLSAFKDPPKSWQIVGAASADISKPNTMILTKGSGVLLNLPDKKNPGIDLYTKEEFGDIDLEMDYMIAAGSNSGIYLQGRYEIQIADSWGLKVMKAGSNGGIYERWDDSKPDGQRGYEGSAPRQNASRAPGVWQNIKISFQAPRFDAAGKKIQNARMLRIELNGVLIHDNVELSGVTRGSMSQQEAALGPIRIQGDHGPVALRNIKITKIAGPRPPERGPAANAVDPILIDAPENTILRSFMDIPGGTRVVHAVSVGSPAQVHYTYDMDNAALVQVWRGGFLNATPMWHDRGDGSSRPQGAVQRFGKPILSLAKLSSPQAGWPADTAGSSYRPKGYIVDDLGRPSFRYLMNGYQVTDATRVMDDGHGIIREISLDKTSPDLYFRLAAAPVIEELGSGLYQVDNQSYFLRIDNAGGARPVIRDQNGQKELILPVKNSFSYSILF